MNVNDSEVIWSILQSHGYKKTETLQEADIVLVVTCAIREGAETKIWNKLKYLRGIKNKRAQEKHRNPMKIGVIGNILFL
jgi:tRNA A37 methylthiotransferase MiaB